MVPVLCLAMVAVPLLSLTQVGDAAPTDTLELRSQALDARRDVPARASRTRPVPVAQPVVAAVATTVVPTTLAPSTTTTTEHVHEPVQAASAVQRATATTAKPKPTTTTSTTAKPKPKPTTTTTAGPERTQTGKASYYDHQAGTCAHRTLPMGTIVRVTNTGNGASTTCRVADRGPYIEGRIIDLDRGTFAEIAPVSAGVINVRISW